MQAETANSASLGLTYQGDAVTFTLDSYRIAIDDRVILTSNAVNRASYPIIDQLLGDSTAQSVRFFTNGLDTTTTGVEAVLAYQLPEQSYGRIRLSLSGQYSKTEIDAIKIPSLLQGLEAVLLNHQEQVRQTKANPKYSATAGITHQYGAFTTNLRLNYFGSYTLAHKPPPRPLAIKIIRVKRLPI
ncbi:TonB-dependent receptor domain-containing protein [Alishewanella longhuensis]